MQALSDKTLLVQLRNEKSSSFELLYTFYFPSIASYIKQNQGNKEDAEDVFQEAIMVLLQKLRQNDFVLTSSLKTYLYAIAKNLWLKRLRDNKLIIVENALEFENQETDTPIFELYPEKTTQEKVENWLHKITSHCQHILKAIFFYNESMDSLMNKMGWKNKHTAANQKYKCIEQIKKEQGA
jgi:RNA polymerase sigma factor (sigma-70 family)